jgi:hypothetical protein
MTRVDQMSSTPLSIERPSDGRSLDVIGLVLVPAANFDIWEIKSRESGWLYGVEAQGANGTSAFAGMLWRQSRLRDDEIPPTAAGRLANVSPLSQPEGGCPLGALAELALLKLVMTPCVLQRPPRIKLYVSAFQARDERQIAPTTLVKKSLASFRPGEETRRPTAVDAVGAFDNWEQAITFASRHPKLAWLEDPLPMDKWPSTAICPVPIATGELAASVADVEAILRFAASTPLVLHLELSRLGPVKLSACIAMARRKSVPIAFHGHLPLDTALILLHLGVGGLVELNLSHFLERAPWPYAEQWMESGLPRNSHLPAGLLSRTLKARAPEGSVKRI